MLSPNAECFLSSAFSSHVSTCFSRRLYLRTIVLYLLVYSHVTLLTFLFGYLLPPICSITSHIFLSSFSPSSHLQPTNPPPLSGSSKSAPRNAPSKGRTFALHSGNSPSRSSSSKSSQPNSTLSAPCSLPMAWGYCL